jgi:hypothetical protein
MKSKLCAAIAAAGCVLAVSPANAVTVASHRGATTSSVPGAVLFDDFDSVQNTAIGTITGGLLCFGVATLVAAEYLERPQPPGISSGWLALTARRQLPR